MQIESMRNLDDGWLDGEGKAPSEQGLNWIAEEFDCYFSETVTPYLYPTPEGGVRTEWSLENWEVSLEIDLDNRTGYWHVLNMDSNADVEKSLNLAKQDDWKWVVKNLLSMVKEQT
jgi:hypothetical protein